MSGAEDKVFRFGEFGEFTIDLDNREIWGPSGQVKLDPRAFDLLGYLIQRPRRLIRRSELMNAIWSGSTVEDANLTEQMSHLRKALGDSARRPLFIWTSRGYGYKFIAKVWRVEKNTVGAA